MADRTTASSRSKKLDPVEKRVKELMEKYHGCAQCTLMAIQEAAGMQDENLVKAAGGLSGGIGGTGSVCGVLTGAALALGMKYGRDFKSLEGGAEDSRKQMMEGIDVVAKLAKWFEREFGTTICREIRKNYCGTELSMEIPWQREWGEQLKMGECCTKMAGRTARRAVQMLENPNMGITEK